MIARSSKKCGSGLLNKLINNLPFEVHIPGYQFCGPGTKLQKRLSRGDSGINPLDAACREHDIAYSQHRENLEARHLADKQLATKALQRVFARDASLGERVAAWGVGNIMKTKTRLGMGYRGRRVCNSARKVKGKLRKTLHAKKREPSSPLRKVVTAAKRAMKQRGDNIQLALGEAVKAVRNAGGKARITVPRILPVPKVGGALPALLIPIFAALSAIGSVSGGAAGIAKAVNDAKAAKKELDESRRHNQAMESIAIGKGLFLGPFKKGMGLYINPSPKKGRGLHLKPYSKN